MEAGVPNAHSALFTQSDISQGIVNRDDFGCCFLLELIEKFMDILLLNLKPWNGGFLNKNSLAN